MTTIAREEKLKQDLFMLRKLNAAFTAHDDMLEARTILNGVWKLSTECTEILVCADQNSSLAVSNALNKYKAYSPNPK